MLQLQEGETIQRVCRRHWFVFSLALSQIGFGFVIAIFLPFLLGVLVPEFMDIYGKWVVPGSVLIAEVMWIVFFFVITDYYLDAWIITNKRLIFVELHGLFSRTVASVNLGDVQDISIRVHGIIPTLLRFGDVRIQSAGTHGEFIFRQIPRPDQVKDLMMQMRAQYEALEKNA
jgi:hypothetical protein